jgi:hypothetical protein
MNGEIAYGQALGPACTDPNSEACWQAKLASAQYSALAECSQVWRYNVGPNNAAGDCQQAQVALQQAQQRPPVGAAAPPAPVQTGPTGIDPANVPKTVDFTNNTMTLGNGDTRSFGPGNTVQSLNNTELQGLCRAGQSNACPGGAVQFSPPAPAAASAASPGEYDYKAAMRQYEQSMRQYEHAQQVYQSALQGGPGRNP